MTLPAEDQDIVWTHPETGQRFYLGSRPPHYDNLPRNLGLIVCLTRAPGENRSRVPLIHAFFHDAFEEPPPEPLARLLSAMAAFDDGRDVFVHCAAGINRSTFVLALYLLVSHSEHIESAAELIRQMRIARPIGLLRNPVFERLVLLADR